MFECIYPANQQMGKMQGKLSLNGDFMALCVGKMDGQWMDAVAGFAVGGRPSGLIWIGELSQNYVSASPSRHLDVGREGIGGAVLSGRISAMLAASARLLQHMPTAGSGVS